MNIANAANSLVGRLVFTAICTSGLLNAAMISFTFASPLGMDGQLTYLDDPAITTPSHDSFISTITSPQFGTGVLSVPNGITNGPLGIAHADLATFTFSSGSFAGSEDSILNFSNGTAVVTYYITGGTGNFAGVQGTVTEQAHFTSLGTFSPSVPSTLAFTGSGTLNTIPEPGTIALLGAGFLGIAMFRNRVLRNEAAEVHARAQKAAGFAHILS